MRIPYGFTLTSSGTLEINIQKKRVKNFRSLWMRIIEKQLRFR